MDVDVAVSSEAAFLLEAAAAGDEVAFRQVIVEHHDDMRRVARYITRDAQLAEEATQATWCIAWRKLGNVYRLFHPGSMLGDLANGSIEYPSTRVLDCPDPVPAG